MRLEAAVPALLALLAACASLRQPGDAVDRYFAAQMDRHHIPGLSLAVVRGGRIVKAAGYGLADLELGVPATASTVYEIGSDTKQFTAVAVMMLVEEGKIALDDAITKYFPDAPAAWSRITVAHLLSHTSGIQNHVAVPGFMEVFRTNLGYATTPARDELVRLFHALPLEFEPGATWSYDNTGYYLLGILVEQASGTPYWQFLRERIFMPLGMQATSSTAPQPIVRNRASGYDRVGDTYENRPALPPAVAFSAGAMLSTVEDLARWDTGLRAHMLLGAASSERLWTACRTADGSLAAHDYGFGWFVDTFHGHRIALHGGGTPGFSSVVYRFLDDDLTIVILANRGDRILDPFAIDIAGMYAPALARAVPAIDPDPGTTSRVRAVVAGLLANKHDPEQFTQPMRAFLCTATARAMWQWIASHGDLASLHFADREDSSDGAVLRYQAELGGNRFWFSVRLAPDGRIAQIRCW